MSGAYSLTRGRRPVTLGARVLGALLLIGALLGGAGVAPSHANNADVPSGPMTLMIHKFAQPQATGDAATGVPLTDAETAGWAPIGGVTFEATRVPGIDLSRHEGWAQAADLTPARAAELSAHEPATARGVTAPDGELVLDGLAVGLYLVVETDAPAGVLRAPAFLVTLPLAHPTESHGWLTTVHVYPKNAAVDVDLAVRDRDAVSCGDTVTWTSRSAIPRRAEIESYRVQQALADGVRLTDRFADIRVEITGQPPLTYGVDYEVHESQVGERWAFDTVFTRAGREKLAVDTEAQVLIRYRTAIERAGEFTNETVLHAGNAHPVRATTTTKFGPLKILVHEKGVPSHLIAGAAFQLFLTEADARAQRTPIVIDGVSEWRTDTDGYITFDCLRFSHFADGLDRAPGTELHRNYYAAPVSYPPGWTGEQVILVGTVTSADVPEVLRAVVWKSGPATELAETGAKMLGAVALGGVLVALGIVLVGRRRPRRES